MNPMIPDRSQFGRFMAWLGGIDGCMELTFWGALIDSRTNRVLQNPKYPTTIGGWFDDPTILWNNARKAHGVSAFLTVNPVDRIKMAECGNALRRHGKGEGTRADDITCYKYIRIDIDYERKGKVSTTDKELWACVELRDRILDERPEIRENAAFGRSGNGAFILVRLLQPLPVDPQSKQKIQTFLNSLAEEYGRKGRDAVHLDVNTLAAANIHLPVPGTWKCKGTDTPERPWRMVILDS